MKKCPWLNQQFILLVQGSPLVSVLRTLPFPAFQVQRRPGNIEERKDHKANIVCVLKASMQPPT